MTQVVGNITTEPIDELMIRINESILFFYNADSYIINKNNLMQSINTETSTPRNIKPKANRSRSKSKKKETKKEEKEQQNTDISKTDGQDIIKPMS